MVPLSRAALRLHVGIGAPGSARLLSVRFEPGLVVDDRRLLNFRGTEHTPAQPRPAPRFAAAPHCPTRAGLRASFRNSTGGVRRGGAAQPARRWMSTDMTDVPNCEGMASLSDAGACSAICCVLCALRHITITPGASTHEGDPTTTTQHRRRAA